MDLEQPEAQPESERESVSVPGEDPTTNPGKEEDPKHAAKVMRWALFALILLTGGLFLFEGPREFLVKASDYLLAADVEGLRDYLRTFGSWAWVLTSGLMVLQGLMAPIPALPILLVNALIYGPWVGALVSWGSAQIASLLCFYMGRGFGRPLVEGLFPKKQLQRFDKFFEEHGGMAIFGTRLIPLVGFDMVSYASGLTKVRTLYFVIATGLGQLPAALVYSYAGAELVESPGKGILIMSGFAGFILAIMALVVWRKRRPKSD